MINNDNNPCQRQDIWSCCCPLPRLPSGSTGWHYLSHATCLMRTAAYYARFVVSRIAVIRKSIRHFERTHALDK